jgi:DnaJ-class molecular chaperone
VAPPPRRASTGIPSAPPDSFSHDRHKHIACIACHNNPSGRGRLTFAAPRGCQICHHQAPATSRCANCHASEAYSSARTVRASVAAAGHPPRDRELTFRHEVHRELQCVACHTTPGTLEPEPSVARCTACHDGHHAPGRDCSACHAAGAEVRAAHTPPVEAHVACDACHAAGIVAGLAPDRAFCLTCHAQQREHQGERACTVCHFQMAPDAFREHLRAGAME